MLWLSVFSIHPFPVFTVCADKTLFAESCLSRFDLMGRDGNGLVVFSLTTWEMLK
jgi:hypothetical protein